MGEDVEAVINVVRDLRTWTFPLGGHRPNFRGVDFSYIDVSNRCFRYCDLTAATFNGAYCEGIDICDAIGADLQGCWSEQSTASTFSSSAGMVTIVLLIVSWALGARVRRMLSCLLRILETFIEKR